jgi:hypothetical protein
LVGEALFVFCAVISSALFEKKKKKGGRNQQGRKLVFFFFSYRVSVAVVGSRSTISAFAGDHVRVGGINEASDECCRWASGEAIIHSVAVGTGLRTVNGVHANLSDGAVNTIAKLSKAVVGIRSAIGAACLFNFHEFLFEERRKLKSVVLTANDHVGIGSCNAAGVLTVA